MSEKINYSEVISFRSKISEKFPRPPRKTRAWKDYPAIGPVLNFGSGKKSGAHHAEISHYYKEVFSCDSDPNAEADFSSIDKIDKKFSLIIAEHVLEHVETEYFVQEMSKIFYDLLLDNGKIVVTVPNLYCYGVFFSDFDHKNICGHLDMACIMCARGLSLAEYFVWSKMKYMNAQEKFSESEKMLETFMEKNYGLQTDRYVTMVFEKNG
jgi:predicted SAM-dependent methyltransferase